MEKVVLLDNGHGHNTAGKCSPDKSIREWSYTREIVNIIYEKLSNLNIKCIKLVPESNDIGLSIRANRANEYCKQYGAGNCLFISVHLNAAGDGSDWMKGTGWEVWTTKGKTNSDEFAECLYEAAQEILTPLGFKMRSDTTDGDHDKESNFTVIYKTMCPAVLTENLFQDNKKDVEFLLSDMGKESIANIHVQGIVKYINKMK